MNRLERDYSDLIAGQQTSFFYDEYQLDEKLKQLPLEADVINRMAIMLQEGGYIRHSLSTAEAHILDLKH